jgi:hypothetical protein
MNDHDLLLVMTICELLGKSVYPGDVEVAYQQAQGKLKTSREPSTPGDVSFPLRPRR